MITRSAWDNTSGMMKRRAWAHLFGALMLFFPVGCTSLFFQPSKEHLRHPKSFPVAVDATDIYFSAPGGPKLHGWWLKKALTPQAGVHTRAHADAPATPASTPAGIILQFHGNAQNISTHVTSLLWLLHEGYELVTFDYRGYGHSEGQPYIPGVVLDGLAALDYVVTHTPENVPIDVVGQSLGGTLALASLAASPHRSRIRSVVIEGSFYSYKDIAMQKMSDVWFLWPFQWLGYVLIVDNAAPLKSLKHLRAPRMLVMHSRQDPIVPLSHGRTIYEKAQTPKCWWPIEERGHIGLANKRPPVYRPAFLAFLTHGECPKL